MAEHSQSRFVVYVALTGNLLIALSKFIAAALSGSSAMWSEGVHSTVDTINEVLLLHGMNRAAMPPDRTHPFGHGRELYFWSFVVAVLVLALGAGVSCIEGIVELRHPTPHADLWLNYLILAIAGVFEGTSWMIALRDFRARKGKLGYFQAFRQSKDPTTFTVLLEDSAALLGLLIAFIGIYGGSVLHAPWMDGAASIGIARKDHGVRSANGVLTMQMGPHQVVAMMSAEFEDALTAPDIEACVNRMERGAREADPAIVALFVKPQTEETWRARRKALEEEGNASLS